MNQDCHEVKVSEARNSVRHANTLLVPVMPSAKGRWEPTLGVGGKNSRYIARCDLPVGPLDFK